MNKKIDDSDLKEGKELFLVASQYCKFIENIKDFQKTQILSYLNKILPLVYLKTSLLPDIALEDYANIEQYIEEELLESVYISLMDKFAEIDYFQALEKTNNEIISCSLVQILADLYQSLKDFVLSFSSAKFATQQAAIWICKDSFIFQWGETLLNALLYIHPLAFPFEKETEDFVD
ncbi:MAG: DUF5063 domain-containing protein [Bacteroidales bacterium]|jgi:hypothetical protein|nr:DUF5063 domain-containing protein [Bacteroidales bacterium]